jgi:tRNA(fMet)-specific endonuclease VapC
VTLCMDTNAYAALKRGNQQIQGLLESADEILIPTIVLGELYAGFAMGSRESANRRALSSFLHMTGVTVVPVSDRVAERYGALMKSLKAQGMPVHTNDVWIASIALETGARILSLDAHFSKIPAVITIPLDPA